MSKNFLSGFVAGTAIGFLIGLLSAPDEGIIFRNRIYSSIEGEVDKISRSANRIVDLFRRKEDQTLTLEEELH